jgi:peptidoglycan hydrolase-like protein with peptidoglycan-binding domain
VLKASRRSGAVVIDDYDDRYGQDEEPSRSRRKDLIALALAGAAVCGILVNALFLQKGPHPAPIFSAKPVAMQPVSVPAAAAAKPVRTVGTELTGGASLPRARPADAEPPKADNAAVKTEPAPSSRSRLELVADIQKELAKRGFYDGAADGVYGPKTDAAIRDFEQSAGLKHAEPSEQLLRAIAQSGAKAKPVTTASAPRHDPIAELIAPSPSKRILSVQRALADFGYGQIKPSGTLDVATQEAIKQFEHSKKMPVTGQISPRLLRELSATTGRPLE